MAVIKGISSLVAYTVMGLVILAGMLTGGFLWGILLGLAILGKCILWIAKQNRSPQ